MKNLTLLLILLVSTSVFAQKNTFQPTSKTVTINGTKYSVQGYEGKPEKLNFKNTVYFNPLDNYNEISKVENDWKVYNMFYSHLPIRSNPVSHHFQPFYFRQFEVTNAEYKEFVKWVRDSIALTYMGYFLEGDEGPEMLDWERVEDLDYNSEDVTEIYLWDSLGNRLGFDISLFMYSYIENDEQYFIPVYPDTTCWTKDHPYAFNQPMQDNYYWHPAYDDYPVVGINYHQAKAYCHWLEMRINQELLENDIRDYEVEVNLPSAMQWQHVAWLQNSQINSIIQDFSWNTDLMMAFDKEQNAIREATNQLNYLKGNYYADGAMYTHLADLSVKGLKKERKQNFNNSLSIFNNLDENNISGMGGNVSEWMRETYTENWKIPFEKHIEALQQDSTLPQLAIDIPMFYYESIPKSNEFKDESRLVYGANWVDERYSMISGKNRDGIFAKTFVASNENYSTLGFRYVIEVKVRE